jgi:hypothetical protein
MFKASRPGWSQVVGRTEPPALVGSQHRMVPGMVIQIGNQRIEDNPLEQLPLVADGIF